MLKEKCPFDNKQCDKLNGKYNKEHTMKSCRYGTWVIHTDHPPCYKSKYFV